MSVFLSVIIPAHNEEISICNTVHSLIDQDYDDYEVIIVDDGSDDNTIQKLTEEFHFLKNNTKKERGSLKHKFVSEVLECVYRNLHIFLIKKENGGKSDALNTGMIFATVIFLYV